MQLARVLSFPKQWEETAGLYVSCVISATFFSVRQRLQGVETLKFSSKHTRNFQPSGAER